jgi:glycosyltransferase involved in cell wall biosynthesis
METAILCNTKMLGGGERSAQKLLEMLQTGGVSARGYSLHPDNKRCKGMEPWEDWRTCKAKHQIWVMNDKIYRLQKEDFSDFITVLQYAEDVRFIINFVHGGLCQREWLKDIPVKKVIFLNSTKEKDWLKKCKHGNENIPTSVLPPPVDIDMFLDASREMRNDSVITIGSHGGKDASDSIDICESLIEKHNLRFEFLPGTSELRKEYEGVLNMWFHPKTSNVGDIIAFLSGLDIYVYHLNPKSHTQGPRTVMEAMAMGLPVVTDACLDCGMKDRIEHGVTGFLCNGKDEIIHYTSMLIEYEELRHEMGLNALRAARNMQPERWLEEII